ncbi:hypothetical protein RHMOL_Rhmol05G0090000 [Rhododendron molle]|uniref:Uncharacterized protein n=1 Tax=Rhododendron molle TaxID=49168 RepID=A0ACC0NNJ4_RHOML|nr:hypothetical protein RHMOL_Rhmol05G0090000 [Rhododendron molle]
MPVNGRSTVSQRRSTAGQRRSTVVKAGQRPVNGGQRRSTVVNGWFEFLEVLVELNKSWVVVKLINRRSRRRLARRNYLHLHPLGQRIQTGPGFRSDHAYSPMPPPGFLASSPQAHPYMWGVQHIMPPYGTTPHPYVAVYPHGGIYAHPSIPPGSYPFSPFPVPSPNGVAEASCNTLSSMETDGKLSEGREKLPIKRSKKSLSSSNTVSGKNNGPGKTSGALANGVCSRSAESASEHSSEGSDADSQNDSQMKSGSGQDSLEGLVVSMFLPIGNYFHWL